MNAFVQAAVYRAAARVCPDRLRRAGYLARAHVLIMAAENGPHCNQYEHAPDCNKDELRIPTNGKKLTNTRLFKNATKEEIAAINQKVSQNSIIVNGIEVNGPCSKEELDEISNTSLELIKKYPIKLDTVIVETDEETERIWHDEKDQILAWQEGTIIHLNGDKEQGGIHDTSWKNSGTKNNQKIKWSCGDQSIHDTILHEWGHAVHRNFAYEKINDNGQIKTVDEFINDMYNTAMGSKDGIKISEYASTDYMEYFAECFVAYDKNEPMTKHEREMITKILTIYET